MKEKWKHFRFGAVILSVSMLILGILTVAYPQLSAVVFCVVLGVICICAGTYKLIRYFRMGVTDVFFRNDLALGIFGVLSGILLIVQPLSAAAFLPFITGIYVLVGSIFDIQVSEEMRRLNIGNWVSSMIMGIVSVVFAFFLIIDPFDGASALMICAGISLIVSSARNLMTIYSVSKVIKADKNDENTEIDITCDDNEKR